MNVNKIALLVGMISFVGASASEWPFLYSFGSSVKRGKFPVSSFLWHMGSFVAFKSYLHNKKENDGLFNRLAENESWYGNTGEMFRRIKVIPVGDDKAKGYEISIPNVKFVMRPLAYTVADKLVSPIVNESRMVTAAVKSFSPEMQQEIKNTVTVIGASALAKSIEALYDHQYNSKTLTQSGKEFALNTGANVTNKVVYYSLVNPVIKNVVSSELEPVADFAAGYATAYVIMQMMKAAQ